jgi:hypothetical protein
MNQPIPSIDVESRHASPIHVKFTRSKRFADEVTVEDVDRDGAAQPRKLPHVLGAVRMENMSGRPGMSPAPDFVTRPVTDINSYLMAQVERRRKKERVSSPPRVENAVLGDFLCDSKTVLQAADADVSSLMLDEEGPSLTVPPGALPLMQQTQRSNERFNDVTACLRRRMMLRREKAVRDIRAHSFKTACGREVPPIGCAKLGLGSQSFHAEISEKHVRRHVPAAVFSRSDRYDDRKGVPLLPDDDPLIAAAREELAEMDRALSPLSTSRKDAERRRKCKRLVDDLSETNSESRSKSDTRTPTHASNAPQKADLSPYSINQRGRIFLDLSKLFRGTRFRKLLRLHDEHVDYQLRLLEASAHIGLANERSGESSAFLDFLVKEEMKESLRQLKGIRVEKDDPAMQMNLHKSLSAKGVLPMTSSVRADVVGA